MTLITCGADLVGHALQGALNIGKWKLRSVCWLLPAAVGKEYKKDMI